ncbi:MAG: outer membrane lipoprotein chaperone LolA [Gammaproteobacteria bacterium]|nr:outer membrane lipoprotein chaperone LolA [Gammaproteobacteria bacterium]
MAGEGEKLLERFLIQSKTMSADFVQTLRAEDNEVLQESKGHFYLNRPGKFRWNYSSPYEQEIVSDGEQVWVFDVDLQQVTVQNKSASLNNTPMALMEGKLKLKEAYNISELDHRDGIYRLKLSSKTKDADFSELIVGVNKQGLQFMQMRDQFDQTTDIVFINLELNKKLDSDLFEFTPPEGVDVYGGS